MKIDRIAACLLFFLVNSDVLAEAPSNKDDAYWVKLFADVLTRTKENYVEKVSSQDLVEAALKGMLSSLDPHSTFVEPNDFAKMQDKYKGAYAGLGIEITLSQGAIKVISAIEDTPAQKAGIRPGDMIVAINNQSLHNLSLSGAVEKVQGKPGEEITLRILRPNEPPFNITLKKEVITLKPVKWGVYGEIGYIRINHFNSTTSDMMEKAFADIQKKIKNLKGVVLDLRNNPGGLFDQSILVASYFLDQKEIVSVKGRNKETVQRYKSRAFDRLKNVPMVVLVNEGTASSAEIVAGALQDNKRALVMGVRTFGKGSVQTIFPLTRHKSAMQITTGSYYTPSGKSIQATGIVPDVEIEEIDISKKKKVLFREENILGAFKNAKFNKAPQTHAREYSGPQDDNQLARAIDFLVGFSVYRYNG